MKRPYAWLAASAAVLILGAGVAPATAQTFGHGGVAVGGSAGGWHGGGGGNGGGWHGGGGGWNGGGWHGGGGGYPGYGYGYGYNSWWPAAALGGLALGAAIGASSSYYAPAYYAPAYPAYALCYANQTVWDPYYRQYIVRQVPYAC